MQYFLRSSISFSLLTAFLFGGLLQAQNQEIKVKIRKQDGDKVIEIDKTFMGDENFDIEEWLTEMGLDQFESDFQNIDVDVEISGDEEKVISIDNKDGEKRIMMIQSDDPSEIEAIMKKHGSDDKTVIIIGGDEEHLINQEDMQRKIMQRIENLEGEMSNNEFEIVNQYFYDADNDKGTLGVMMQVDDNNQKPIVSEVISGSAAEKAGIQINDEITAIGSTKVSSYEAVVEALASLKKGDSVEVSFNRTSAEGDVKSITKTVELGGAQKRMQFYGVNPHPERMDWVERSKRGVSAVDCCAPTKAAEGTNDDHGYIGVQIVDTDEGVLIESIAPGSAASKSNMAEGMTILSVDREKIRTADQLIAIAKTKKPGDKVKVKYADATGKTWKEKIRLQSKPAAFAKASGCCAPADMAICSPGQAGAVCTPEEMAACFAGMLGKVCTPEQIEACCAKMGCTPEQMAECMAMAGKTCTPEQIAKCRQMMGMACSPKQMAACGGFPMSNTRNYTEIHKEQNGETTKIVIIEKDKSNNSDSAKIKVIISEAKDAETKVLGESENAPKGNLKSLELEELNFFPNPSDGNVQLSFRGEENDYNIRITDLSGKEIYRGKTGKVSEFQTMIDISDNPDGVYLLQIYSDSQLLNRKIIVK